MGAFLKFMARPEYEVLILKCSKCEYSLIRGTKLSVENYALDEQHCYFSDCDCHYHWRPLARS
jgi:hypothetical protein